MEKYVNFLGTFVDGDEWVCWNAEAIVLRDSGPTVRIALKHKEAALEIDRAIFEKHFRHAGETTPEDEIEFASAKHKLKKADMDKLIQKHYSGEVQKLLLDAVKKAYQDAYTSAGNSKIMTVAKFKEFQRKGKQVAGSSLKREGDPVFNRAPRWSPVADYSEWEQLGSPAPIGIRGSDFARLSDCNEIYLDLLYQIFSMDHGFGVPSEISEYIGRVPKPGTHKCEYCGEVISLQSFNEQKYAAKEHALNFCHRDPSEHVGRTAPGNVYFGHTSCNRIQGGLSEVARIIDGLRLLELHKEEYVGNLQIQRALEKVLEISELIKRA